MPNTITHKKSTTASAVPSGASLSAGEIAINTADGRLFIKKSDGTVVAIGRNASELNTGTVAAAQLPAATGSTLGAIIVGTGLGVASGTVSVSYGSTSSTACVGNDSRLSDARTPLSHTHGNITNAGAIGSTANLPVITTTSGVLTTGTFGGTGATNFVAGNDQRIAKAWVNFDGTSSAAVSGTYTQSASTTVTCTITAHGLTTGQVVQLSFTSGTAPSGGYVVTVTGANTFTVTSANNTTTSGNVTAAGRTIRSSSGVSSVVYNATGDYFVNFSAAMSDSSYACVATAGGTATAAIARTHEDGTARNTWFVRINTLAAATGFAAINPAQVSVVIFR